MSALESAFVNSVISGEGDKTGARVPREVTEKRLFQLFKKKIDGRDGSEYVCLHAHSSFVCDAQKQRIE
jgi:hypothetical protein